MQDFFITNSFSVNHDHWVIQRGLVIFHNRDVRIMKHRFSLRRLFFQHLDQTHFQIFSHRFQDFDQFFHSHSFSPLRIFLIGMGDIRLIEHNITSWSYPACHGQECSPWQASSSNPSILSATSAITCFISFAVNKEDSLCSRLCMKVALASIDMVPHPVSIKLSPKGMARL